MTQGVIYFNQGTKCIIRILVSLFSLRKQYTGNVTLLNVGMPEKWVRKMLKRLNIDLKIIPDIGVRPLVRKAQLWEDAPYDVTMFIDADTVVVGPIDEYFDKIKEYGFCTGEFAGWKTTGRTISGRIKRYSNIMKEWQIEHALEYGKATNTGIFGFTKDSEFLAPWKRLTVMADKHGCSPIPDELSCQMLLADLKHWLAPIKWGVSVNKSTPEHLEDARIIHYHGRKHVREDLDICRIWKSHYWEMRRTFPTCTQLGSALGDRRLARYLQNTRNDLTIVTAVDAKYLPKLLKHYHMWMKTEGLYEHPMVCYYDKDSLKEEDLSFLKGVKLIPWSGEYDSQREKMLTCFVIGTARDIKTDYWLKIDADVSTKTEYGSLDLPDDAFNSVLAGHKWGYTKSKAATNEKHFLNTLDDWWEGKTKEKPVFPKDIPWRERHGHPRIASFICLHKAEFTRLCAKHTPCKLPVPSHDTYMWYMAHRLGEPICRLKLKRNFSA